MKARLLVMFLFVVLGGGILCGSAYGKAEIRAFSIEPRSTSLSGATQAGGHPDLLVETDIGNHSIPPFVPCECNDPKDILVDPPAGLIGTPTDVPRCTSSEFATNLCPTDTQVGLLIFAWEWTPLYNLVPPPGQLALLGGTTPGNGLPLIFLSLTARTDSDYGVEFRTGVPRSLPVTQVKQIVWGVPADPSHDHVRFPVAANKRLGCFLGDRDPLPELLANEFPLEDCGPFLEPTPTGVKGMPVEPIPANSPAVPFLSNPTTCGRPLRATIRTLGYDLEPDFGETSYPETVGCDQLSFDPSLSARPTTTAADSPSGIDVRLTVPQTLSPSTPSPSAIRAVTVKLPPGMTINANAADGKTSCSALEARIGTREQAQCPEFAKIGTVDVLSASFPGVLPGAIYLSEPLPGDRYRVVLVFDGHSLHVKLPGRVIPDPLTGQLAITFEELPQFNFQEFDMHVFGAERGILATPERCGTYAVNTEFVPWATGLPNQTSTQFFVIDSGPDGRACPDDSRPFAPSLAAGVADNTGGAYSPLALRLTREDGDQNLTGVTVQAPPGTSASLRGIPYCPEQALERLAAAGYRGSAEQLSAACPDESRVGTALAAAGAGSRPLRVSGKVYLAGPYRGAPVSFVVVIPAVSGPYDLGTVSTRIALDVDPRTADVTATSDPFPQIIEGVPLRVRMLQVDLNRPSFTINPTNCDPFSVSADLFGDQGGIARLASHFQVANCADLEYGPKLTLRLTGGVARRGHPAIHAILKVRPGEANTRRVSVTLPPGELLDNAHIGTVCTRADFAARSCPRSSAIGTAEAATPLLDRPLTGNVYLRSSSNELPDIAIDLRGQVDFELAGRVDSVKGRLRTTFESVPDVPITRFDLRLAGGRKGLVQNTEDLCGRRKKASARFLGQNGRVARYLTELKVACGARREG